MQLVLKLLSKGRTGLILLVGVQICSDGVGVTQAESGISGLGR